LNHRHEFQLRSRCTFTSARIEGAVYDLFDVTNEPDLQNALSRYPKLIATNFSTLESEFMEFLSVMSIDDNWKFWTSFIMQDLASYMAVFIGIRTRNWDLRVAGIKEMAPLFLVFDRPTYRQLIPDHLTQVLTCEHRSVNSSRQVHFQGQSPL